MEDVDQAGGYGRQRAAAARNRALIVNAARELFAEDPHATLTAVAGRAGVGPGTLYRHFPTRDDLLLAAYQGEIDALAESVDDVLRASASAKDAFVEWFAMLAASIRRKHRLGDALHSAAAQAVADEAWGPMSVAVGKLLDACVAEGVVAQGHDAADVIMLMSFLWRVAPTPDGRAQATRLLDVVFAGLGSA
ncbi:TetR/AcrR family transcriptional regulator [Tsukamurella pseudospumae]|uniref:TetR family transcriptional regulator n=1 Tax=Tsukamurella pseudospumae TaxID=239498 RepID=A0A138AIW6_9ACTN|nr:TetR/AcrR family transcriptional regulator [Tsukamurella pseudospumae]KXP00059.1 TetR family transcriptional regulator [Tsukamurella pseudospumae]KXP10319.1 TetR family transcriptional regulator [Tsukamurella pseudospumae]